MIDTLIAVGFGSLMTMLCSLFGVWLRSGWLARKLTAKPLPKNTQQIPTVSK